MFMSGSDDGTVRHYDTRDPASTTTIPGMRTGEMIGRGFDVATLPTVMLCYVILIAAA